MEMKPTLQICIGNWTQNDAQVESIMMKMKRTSTGCCFFLSNLLLLSQRGLFPKEPHQNILKFLYVNFLNILG